jgi:hypothetical protein
LDGLDLKFGETQQVVSGIECLHAARFVRGVFEPYGNSSVRD